MEVPGVRRERGVGGGDEGAGEEEEGEREGGRGGGGGEGRSMEHGSRRAGWGVGIVSLESPTFVGQAGVRRDYDLVHYKSLG